jgi:hypothetical protein
VIYGYSNVCCMKFGKKPHGEEVTLDLTLSLGSKLLNCICELFIIKRISLDLFEGIL